MQSKSAASRLAIVLASFGVVAGSTVARAASAQWSTTTTDTAWATGTNWSTGTPPGAVGTTDNTDSATFRTSGTTTPGVVVDSGRNIQNLYVTGATGSTVTTYTFSGASLALTSGGVINVDSNSGTGGPTFNNALQIVGNAATYGFSANQLSTRSFTVNGAVSGTSATGSTTTLTLGGTNATGSNNITGVVSDGANGGKLAIAKNDAGIWSLSNNANTFTGGLAVSNGTLQIGLTSAYPGASYNVSSYFGTGGVTMTGGRLNFLGSGSAVLATFTNDLTVAAGNTGNVNFQRGGTFNPNSIGGTGTVTLSGNSGVTITTADLKNFAGTIDTTGLSNFRLGNNYVAASMQNARLNLAAGTAQSTQFGSTTNPFNVDIGSLSGAGTLGGSAAGANTIFYRIGYRNEDTAFTGTIVNGGTQTGLVKVGTGTLTLSGANTYGGTTTLGGGTLNINGVNAVGGANFGGTVFTGGTLQYAATLTSGSDLSSKPMTFTSTAVIDTNGNNVTYASGVGNGGTGGLTKNGTGSLTLAGVNAYTGSTTVNAGSLALAGSGQLTFVIGASGVNNALLGLGTAQLDGTFLFDLTNASTTPGSTWTIVSPTLAKAYGSTFAVNGFTNNGNGTFGNGTYTFSEATGQLSVTAVPEPTTLAAVGLAAAFGLRRRRA